jgi:hypothetical protein
MASHTGKKVLQISFGPKKRSPMTLGQRVQMAKEALERADTLDEVKQVFNVFAIKFSQDESEGLADVVFFKARKIMSICRNLIVDKEDFGDLHHLDDELRGVLKEVMECKDIQGKYTVIQEIRTLFVELYRKFITSLRKGDRKFGLFTYYLEMYENKLKNICSF